MQIAEPRGISDEDRRVGKVISEARLKSGKTQEQVAKAAGINRSFLSLVESGQRRLPLSTTFRIAEALKIPPEGPVTSRLPIGESVPGRRAYRGIGRPRSG